MKKLLIFAITLALFSCSKETPQYTILSGKYTGSEDGKFKVRGIAFEKEITVNQDGTFTDTLHIDYNGAYRIGRQEIYLHQGKNLGIDVNAQDWTTLKFTGDLQAENTYIIEKQKIEQEIIGSDNRAFYLVDEADFLAKMNLLDTKRKELLEKTTFAIKDFKEKELRSLGYHKHYMLDTYIEFQKYYGGNPDFQVSENFPKKAENFDFENAEEYNFSSSYRSVVMSDFYKKVENEIGEDQSQEKYFKALLNHFKNVKAANIKNSLAPVVAQGISASNENSEEIYNYLMANVSDEKFKTDLTDKFNKVKTLIKGNASPTFNYENHKGGTTSLDDLKGKFVYIDVWATWCGPCKREIPFLKEVEKKYHGKNIEFVSISIDDKKDYETWKKFVSDNQLGGVQLYADNAWESQFVKDYVIDGIPRFILLDTEGKIVSADAPRPSDEKLIELFNELGI